MYIPKIHKPADEISALDYIKKHGFATFISQGSKGVTATHIPMYLDTTGEKPYLVSHISVANEQKLDLNTSSEHLAIFMDTHAYISSSWYDHINVPTWNYISVHVYGKSTILKGSEIEQSLVKLVDQYEKGRDNRFYLSDMPEKMKSAHFRGLVAFKMSMDRIEVAHKLSQNRSDKDYQNVISHLEKEADKGSHSVAHEMKKLRS